MFTHLQPSQVPSDDDPGHNDGLAHDFYVICTLDSRLLAYFILFGCHEIHGIVENLGIEFHY